MKKLITILIVTILLVACQPTATPTSEPPEAIPQPLPSPTSAPTAVPTPVITESLADSVYLLQGLWYNPRYSGLILSISAPDSSSELTWSSYSLFIHQTGGTAKFENGKFSYLTADGFCINAQQATYNFYIIKQDGFITGMRLEPVGSDPCEARAEAPASDIWYYAGSALMPEGVERPPKTGGELFGIWSNQLELLMNFELAHIDMDTGEADFNVSLYVPTTNPWFEAGKETATYKDGQLIWLTSESACTNNPDATYRVTMITLNDKVVAMRLDVVGDDLCTNRKEQLDGRIIRKVNQ